MHRKSVSQTGGWYVELAEVWMWKSVKHNLCISVNGWHWNTRKFVLTWIHGYPYLCQCECIPTHVNP